MKVEVSYGDWTIQLRIRNQQIIPARPPQKVPIAIETNVRLGRYFIFQGIHARD